MQRGMIYLVLVCAVFVLMPAVCSSQPSVGVSVPAEEVSLQGISELSPYVLMYWTGEMPSDDLAEEVEKLAAQKLKEAGFKIGPSEPNEAIIKALKRRIGQTQGKLRWRSINLPELMIRIYAIKHQGSGTCVFNVQTSLARKVYTADRPHKAMKAEVWRIDVGPSATSAENFETELAVAVLLQVDAFIAAYQKANSGVKERVSKSGQRQDTVVPITGNQETEETATEDVKESFVASKNSRVFHYPSCYAAKRISPKNLVKYNSREEAIRDGKRPCKICKP